MEELKSLKAQLMRVQQRPVGPKLSDRNMVQIVQKLVQSYGLQLVLTSSGKQYLTPSRLMSDLQKVLRRQGRVNLVDLPPILNVNVQQLEHFAQKLSQNPDIFLVNGQLIISTYFDDLAQQVNQSLQQTGQVQLTDLSYKFALPVDLLTEQIQKRLDTFLQGSFKQSNALFTSVYKQRHLARLRGTLRAVQKPFSVKAFDQSLVDLQVKELLRNKEIKGKYNKKIFTPHVYQANISQHIQSFFRQNQYIEYEHARRLLQVPTNFDIKETINKYLEEGVHLVSSYVHPRIIERIQEQIREALTEKDYIDIFMDLELPNCIAEQDMELLLIPDTHFLGHFIIRSEFIQKTVQVFDREITLIAEQYKTEQVKSKKRGNPSLSLDHITQKLRKIQYLQDLDDLYQEFSELVQSVLSKAIIQKQNQLRPAEDIDPSQIEQTFQYLLFCYKSLKLIQKRYSNIKALQVHLIKQYAWNILHQLVAIQILNQGSPFIEINSNNRNTQIEKLPKHLQEILKQLVLNLQSKQFQSFLQNLLGNSKDIPVATFKQLDKKQEKSRTLKQKKQLSVRTKEAIAQRNQRDIFYYGLRYKLMSSKSLFVDVPQELWALQALRDIYANTLGGDPVLEFSTECLEDMKLRDPQNDERISSLLESAIPLFRAQ